MLGRIGARSSEDGSAARQNSAYGAQVQHHRLVLKQSPPPLEKPDELILVVKHSLAHHRADDGIQARTISSAG